MALRVHVAKSGTRVWGWTGRAHTRVNPCVCSRAHSTAPGAAALPSALTRALPRGNASRVGAGREQDQQDSCACAHVPDRDSLAFEGARLRAQHQHQHVQLQLHACARRRRRFRASLQPYTWVDMGGAYGLRLREPTWPHCRHCMPALPQNWKAGILVPKYLPDLNSN